MKLFVIVGLATVAVVATAYSQIHQERRAFFKTLSGAVATTTVGVAGGNVPSALADDATGSTATTTTPVYFGVGCFWHIQHEFVQAERDLLGRQDNQLTSMAGYAGGKSTGPEGKVCYHNMQMVADYGRLGHGEVVGMEIPEKSIADFARVYFSLFDQRTKDRVDPQDRGGEYRSLLGLPGGISHPSYAAVEDAARNSGFRLVEGKGNDPDTLGKQIVFVYDSNQFPFYQAEVYHQYHNDFQSPPYGKAYNRLADVAYADGRIKSTGCPDRV